MEPRQLDTVRTTEEWEHTDLNFLHAVSWYAIDFLRHRVMQDTFGYTESVQYIHRVLRNRNGGRIHDYEGAALLCGEMSGERHYFEPRDTIQFKQVDGFDISEALMARYQPAGFMFKRHQQDCNDIMLEPDKYDLILLWHGAHHVYNLGNLFYQCNKALKRTGLLLMYEWIGPQYLQIPRINHIVSAIILYSMFSRVVRTTVAGKVRGRWIQYSPHEFEPSEACNSPELMPQFLRYFRPLHLHQFGGLTYPVFEGNAHRLNQRHALTMVKVKWIYQAERLLTKLRVVQPLFAVALAEKRMIL